MKIKLHPINICLLLLTIYLVGLNIHKFISYARWDRVYFSVSIGCANGLPIHNDSHIMTRKGEKVSFWTDELGDGDWGNGGGERLYFSSPPDSLLICYLSLRERKVYKGAFKLPAQLIDSLYQLNNMFKELYTQRKTTQVFGYDFVLGIGPLGEVTVWLKGNLNYQKEIGYFTCSELNKWQDSKIQDLEDYILSLDYLSETDSLLRNKIPFDVNAWKNKREKFLYYLWVDPNSDVKTALIDFLNEEREVFDFTHTRKILVEKCMPSYFRLNWFVKPGRWGYESSLSINDSVLITVFNLIPTLITPADTMVLYLSGNTKDKSTSLVFTNTKELSYGINNVVQLDN